MPAAPTNAVVRPRPTTTDRPPARPGTPAAPLRAQALSSAIGAVVDAADLDEAGQDGPSQLRRLVSDRHVVFVRGFGRDEGRFREVASSFGTLTVHPLQRFTGREQPVSVIEDTPAHPPAQIPWHTDLSWL